MPPAEPPSPSGRAQSEASAGIRERLTSSSSLRRMRLRHRIIMQRKTSEILRLPPLTVTQFTQARLLLPQSLSTLVPNSSPKPSLSPLPRCPFPLFRVPIPLQSYSFVSRSCPLWGSVNGARLSALPGLSISCYSSSAPLMSWS